MKEEIFHKLKEAIISNVELNDPNLEINENTQLNTLGMNSFNFIKILVVFEDIYNIDFIGDELNFYKDKIPTVDALVAFISEKIQNK